MFWRSTIVVVWLWLGCLNPVRAQLFDSIAESLSHPPTFLISLDARNSFVTAEAVKMRGVKVGLNFNRRVKFGLGFNWMAEGFERPIDVEENGGLVEKNGMLRFWHITPFFDYNFYHTRYWDISLPLQLGIGASRFRYDVEGKNVFTAQGPMVLYEPAMVVIYKPIPWFGAGVGVGYRLMLVKNDHIAERFTSPIYALKFAVYFDRIYNDLKKD